MKEAASPRRSAVQRLLRAAPGVIKVVCRDLIPAIIIDDYRRATPGDGVWDFRGTLVGGGSIDLLPWNPVNNIRGLEAPTHVDSAGTEVHVESRQQPNMRTNEAFRCRLRISHMHHQNETRTARELASATNPSSPRVRGEKKKKKCLKHSKNTNVVADNDFSH